MTQLALVVAHTRNRVIGRDNAMPWHLPADLRHFRELTWGQPILMGRRTHQAIGRVLPGRRNLVLSHRAAELLPGAEWVESLSQALAHSSDAAWVYVVGGAEIYRLALPLAARLHVTEIALECAGDAYFPPLDAQQWRETARLARPADVDNAHALSFVTLERISPPAA
jgi:dihydrofolate reductase